MINRATLFLIWFAAGVLEARCDEPASPAGSGRVIEGTVTAGGKPIAGARVLIGEFGRGMSFESGAAATADAHGRYRVDLGKFSWAKSATRAGLAARPLRWAIERSSRARYERISSWLRKPERDSRASRRRRG